MNFSIEESKENDLIIKQQLETSKRGQFETFYFHKPYRQPVRINNQGDLLLGLAKSIYYPLYFPDFATLLRRLCLCFRAVKFLHFFASVIYHLLC